MPKILVADDDKELLDLLKLGLEHQTYEVDLAVDGVEAKELLTQNDYDVLVLDWTMPRLSGLDLCRWCRVNQKSVPILMLTGRDKIQDKVKGLDSGADDYLTKPFHFGELLPRLRALIRRCAERPSSQINVGPLTVDPDSHTALLNGVELELTPREFSILEFLAKHHGQEFNTDALISRVWASPANVSSNLVRVHIKRLRKKLASIGYPDLLVCVYRVGYKLVL